MSGDSSFEFVNDPDKKNDSFELIGDAEMDKINREVEEDWEVLSHLEVACAAYTVYKDLYKEAVREHIKMTKAREEMGDLRYMENGLSGYEYKQHMIKYTTILKKMILVRKRSGDDTLERMLEGAVKTDIIRMTQRENAVGCHNALYAQAKASTSTNKQRK